MTETDERRAALVFTGLLIIGSSAAWLFWSLPSHAHMIACGAANLILFALLLVYGAGRGRLVNAIVLVSATITLAQIWITNDLAMRAGLLFRPFEGYKLLSLGLALLAPSSLWVGVVPIVVTAILPLVQIYLWPPSFRDSVPQPEPWVTVFYCFVAMILLFHRRQQLAARVAVARLQTKATYVEQFMHKFQAVRDLANSPLQAIEATLALLRRKHPESQAQILRIDRQMDRLRKLTTVLSRYHPRTRTPATDERSFNALEVLQREEDSPTKEFDSLFLVARDGRKGHARRDPEQEKFEQLLRFTSFGLENSPLCAFWLTLDGRVVYVNKASCASLGYLRSELLGMHISTFAPRVTRESWRHVVEEFRHQRPRPYRSVHRRKDGTLVPVDITALYAELNGRGYLLGFARELEVEARTDGGADLPARATPDASQPGRA